MYHDPMYRVLQSSYKDVEHEVRVMCGREPPPPAPPGPHASMKIMFVAGDGLCLMRLNHLLASHPDLYISMTPFIVPIQGVRRESSLVFGASVQHGVLGVTPENHPN